MKLRILKKIDSMSIIITAYFQYFVFLSDKSKLYKSKLCIETAPNFFSMSYRYVPPVACKRIDDQSRNSESREIFDARRW